MRMYNLFEAYNDLGGGSCQFSIKFGTASEKSEPCGLLFSQDALPSYKTKYPANTTHPHVTELLHI